MNSPSARPTSPNTLSRKVAVIPGDGIGQEVMRVGLRILEALSAKGFVTEATVLDLGADRFLRDGSTYPQQERDFIERECGAVLLGALGDPRVPDLGYARDILFGLRFGLDLYCNVRPVLCLSDTLMPLKDKRAADCNMVVFRENTEGVYVGMGGNFKKGTPDEIAINEDLNSYKGVERIIRAAFDYAVQHGRKRVTMSDKSNAMQFAHGLWQRVFQQVKASYPAIEAKHMYVDALCLQMVRDPASLDVVVTNNLFGDIVTDLGAALQGGLGMAASANIRPGGIGLFEPVHGSAPDIAGKNLANPLATVLTIGMLMTHLGYAGVETKLAALVQQALQEGQCTPDVGGARGTEEVGAWLVREIRAAF